MYSIIEYNDDPRIPFIKVHRWARSLVRAHEEVKQIWKNFENVCQQSVLTYELTDEKDYDLIECNSVPNESTILYKSTAYLLSVKKDSTLTFGTWREIYPECPFPEKHTLDDLITSAYILDCYQKGLLSMDDLFDFLSNNNYPLRICSSHRVIAILKCESMD